MDDLEYYFPEIEHHLLKRRQSLFQLFSQVLDGDDLSESEFSWSDCGDESDEQEQKIDAEEKNDQIELDDEQQFDKEEKKDELLEHEKVIVDKNHTVVWDRDEERGELLEQEKVMSDKNHTVVRDREEKKDKLLEHEKVMAEKKHPVLWGREEKKDELLEQEKVMAEKKHPVLWDRGEVGQWFQIVESGYLFEGKKRRGFTGVDLMCLQMDGIAGLDEEFELMDDAAEKQRVLAHLNRLVDKYVPEGPDFAILARDELNDKLSQEQRRLHGAKRIQTNVRLWINRRRGDEEKERERDVHKILIKHQVKETRVFFSWGIILETMVKHVFFQASTWCILDIGQGELLLALYLQCLDDRNLCPKIAYGLEFDEENAKLARARSKRLERELFLMQSHQEITEELLDKKTLVVMPYASDEIDLVPFELVPDLFIFDLSISGGTHAEQVQAFRTFLGKLWVVAVKAHRMVNVLLFSSFPLEPSNVNDCGDNLVARIESKFKTSNCAILHHLLVELKPSPKKKIKKNIFSN